MPFVISYGGTNNLRRRCVLANELQVFNNGLFGSIRIVELDDKPYAVASDVARILGYSEPHKAVARHCKGGTKHPIPTSSGVQDMKVIPEGDIYRLIIRSKLPEAEVFEQWVMDEVLPTIRKTGHYETPEYKLMLETKEELADIKKLLVDSGVIRTNINPRYTFDRLNVRYKIATENDNQRGFYDAISNYFGIAVPFSSQINVTVKDWVLSKISIDVLQEFILGIETGTIVKSKRGYYVNLNGFGGNSVEWDKILESFNHECAYCGVTKALIPEHIVPQSLLSSESPGDVDLIGNIVPSCCSCNGSKGKHEMIEWYKDFPQYKQWRLNKIVAHQVKYEI